MSKYKKKVYIPLMVCDYVGGCEDKKCDDCDKKRLVIEEELFKPWMQPVVGTSVFYSERAAQEHIGG